MILCSKPFFDIASFVSFVINVNGLELGITNFLLPKVSSIKISFPVCTPSLFFDNPRLYVMDGQAQMSFFVKDNFLDSEINPLEIDNLKNF